MTSWTYWPDLGVHRGALRFDEPIEAGLVENSIQACIERVARAPRQVRAGHPHRWLPHQVAAFAHCHAGESSTGISSCRSLSGTFTTGC